MDKVNYSLSNGDISKFFNGQIKILLFSQIADYETLDDLLKPYNRVIILWETAKRRGHWTCLFKNIKDEIFFFDSYAIKPEGELRYSAGKNKYLNQQRNTLLRLFKGHYVRYNDIALQKWSKGINTCGRWCILRLCFDDLDSRQFAKLIKSQTDNPDQFVTDLTNIFLSKLYNESKSN